MDGAKWGSDSWLSGSGGAIVTTCMRPAGWAVSATFRVSSHGTGMAWCFDGLDAEDPSI
jgi:hypothetical protein